MAAVPLVFSIADPALGISWRIGEAGDFRDRFRRHARSGIRKRMLNLSIELPPMQAATIRSVHVDQQAIAGAVSDPLRSRGRADPRPAQGPRHDRDERLSFAGQRFPVYYTHLVSYRCAIREVRVGINSTVPDKVLKMPACDPPIPARSRATCSPI